MNIFLISWSTDILIKSAKELKKQGIDIAYWSLNWKVSAFNQINKEDFPNTIFHHDLDAAKAISAQGIDVSKFEPLSKELISKLYECESQVLTMMNRMDYSKTPFHQRKRIYYQCLKYWQGVLENMRPDVILFAQTPHMIYDFVLYSLAKVLGVKTLILDMTTVPCRLIAFNDIKKFDEDIINQLPNSPGQVGLESLPKDLQEYFLKMSDKKRNYLSYQPDFIRRVKKTILVPHKSHLATFGDDFKGLQYVREKRRWEKKKRLFRKEYKGLQKAPKFDKKFIFFPLQFQPEKSTSPLADVFVDQLLIVDILAKAIPKDWLIYIKEHPAQLMAGGSHGQQGRHLGYYQRLTEYSNVRILPIETAVLDLILHCKAMTTATGTTGWEALLRERPVLCFGYSVFRHCEGVFNISSVSDCQEAIDKIINGYQMDIKKVLNFLNVLDSVAIKGYMKKNWEKYTIITEADNIKNIVDALYKKITNYE